MALQITDSGRFTLITPDGALLEETRGPLQAELHACLVSGRTRLVLDLGAVPFIDSSGLELLLDTARSLRAVGGRLELANPNPLCSEILTATRLNTEIDVVFDLEQAGRSFR